MTRMNTGWEKAVPDDDRVDHNDWPIVVDPRTDEDDSHTMDARVWEALEAWRAHYRTISQEFSELGQKISLVLPQVIETRPTQVLPDDLIGAEILEIGSLQGENHIIAIRYKAKTGGESQINIYFDDAGAYLE